MPELPEVETVRRGMQDAVLGKAIKSVQVNRYDLRKEVPHNLGQAITGRIISSFKRRGKYIIISFEPVGKDGVAGPEQQVVVLHLGMSGRVHIYKPDSDSSYEPHKHDHVVIYMSDGTCIAYEDPRRFGMVILLPDDGWEKRPPFAAMGPEPLEEWSEQELLAKLRGKKAAIKTALLDQRIVAGLGNIYVCEALYMAGVAPERPAYGITLSEAREVVKYSKAVLERAIEAGGSTLKDYQKTDGSLGYFQHQFAVYDRAGSDCQHKGCGGSIIRISQAGRSTFYCPDCQK